MFVVQTIQIEDIRSR